MLTDLPVTLLDIYHAYARIRPWVRHTPLVKASSFKGNVWLKLENQQETGAFKLRGATNRLLTLREEEKKQGVVACSTGNHGRAVAFAANRLGVRSVICMSELVPQNKVDAVRSLGAEVRIIGRSQDDAQKEMDKLVREGMIPVPPFDHPEVVAGQGTIALEILEDQPDIDTILVPLSGGGLIAGIALALKIITPSIRVIGVSMERGAAMYASQQAGKPVEVEELPTLADSLGGGIGLNNRVTFPIVRECVDDIILLTEEEIAHGMRHLYFHEQQVVEGAGAVGAAALLAGKVPDTGNIATILSGKNIDMHAFHRVMNKT